MKKNILSLCLIPVAVYFHAQDVSTIRNTAEVYSNGPQFGSAKYSAMAGSMGALGGDVSAMNTNPAALGVFITGEISATMNMVKNSNTSSIAGKSLEQATNKTNLGQTGGVATFTGNDQWKFVNIGVNYVSQELENYIQSPSSGSMITRNLYDAYNNPVIGNFMNVAHAYDRIGNTSKMNIGIGGNYNNKIYVGGSVSFSSANLEQYDTQRFSLDVDNNANYDFNRRFTPFSENANGISIAAGIIAKVSPQFRVGASIESPTWWKMDRVFTGQLFTKNGVVIPDSQWLDSNGFVSENYTEDRTLTTPAKMTLSGAFVPNKSFAINIDYTLGLSKPNYKVQGDAETELNDFFKQNYKNISDFRIGAEYRYDAFRLRGGYGFSSSAFKDNDYLGKKQTLGLGLGYDFKSFFVDAAYQMISADYNSYYGRGDYFSKDISLYSDKASIATVKNKQNNFFLTAGWKF
ncbi:OmpP1/FadL family transporter [Riemerella columbina]|uniref:OmpP1/FadL family transporter n=1 Tax=Riemerella columbina TaxID=103810 RepID=UPI000360A0C0|nr:outer membrane protein transport protein [Riemerella columbina]